MSRKMSAYARKRLAQGKALGHQVQAKMDAGFTIMSALAASADRDAPAPAGGEFLEGCVQNAADNAEKRIREALGYWLDHKLPEDPEEIIQTINAALVLGGRRILEILYGQVQPKDDEDIDLSMLPEDGREALLAIQAGRHAWIRAVERWRNRGQWGLDAEGRTDLQDAMDTAILIMRNSTVQQMELAYREASKQLNRMQSKGLI